MMKRIHFFNPRNLWAYLACASFATSALAKPGNTVVLPAGSSDALADAIADAGPGGTVLVKAGTHSESDAVVIDIPISIIGEDGAVLEVATTPGDRVVDPALHILDTQRVLVEGLTLLPPEGPIGNVAILIQDSPHVTIRGNAIADFETGVFVHGGDHVKIEDNVISDMDLFGIFHVNGDEGRIIGNVVDRLSRMNN